MGASFYGKAKESKVKRKAIRELAVGWPWLSHDVEMQSQGVAAQNCCSTLTDRREQLTVFP